MDKQKVIILIIVLLLMVSVIQTMQLISVKAQISALASGVQASGASAVQTAQQPAMVGGC